MAYEIPEEGHIPFLDITIPIHWENHAVLMFGVWFVLVPLAVMILRYGKIKPRTYGIPRDTPKLALPELCWTLHFWSLRLAMFLAIAGALFAILLSGGFSATLHAWFGTGTVLMGMLQVVSSWFRGTHGGRKDPASDPEDRATWGGDHFDMTPQRWWFETYHKTAGYFTMLMAFGAVATGLSQFWMPWIAAGLVLVFLVTCGAAIVLQGLGYHHDTYQSVFGTHPEHPFNKRRFGSMLSERDMKP